MCIAFFVCDTFNWNDVFNRSCKWRTSYSSRSACKFTFRRKLFAFTIVKKLLIPHSRWIRHCHANRSERCFGRQIELATMIVTIVRLGATSKSTTKMCKRLYHIRQRVPHIQCKTRRLHSSLKQKNTTQLTINMAMTLNRLSKVEGNMHNDHQCGRLGVLRRLTRQHFGPHTLYFWPHFVVRRLETLRIVSNNPMSFSNESWNPHRLWWPATRRDCTQHSKDCTHVTKTHIHD